MFSLDELLLMIRLIKDRREIIGSDITGDRSRILVKGLFKKMLSYIDHPKETRHHDLGEPEITAVNEETNLRILEAI